MNPSDAGEKSQRDADTSVPAKNQVPAAEPAGAIDAVASATSQSVYVEQLLARQPKEESVCAISEIREVRTFSKREILEQIVAFAVANKLELKDAEISRVVTNKEGTVLILAVKVPNADGSYQRFSFTINGKHGRDYNATTNIDRTFWDNNDMPESGDIVLEYLNGRWEVRS